MRQVQPQLHSSEMEALLAEIKSRTSRKMTIVAGDRSLRSLDFHS